MHLEHSIKPSHSPGPVPPLKPFVPNSPMRRWHQEFSELLIKPFKPLKFIVRSHNSCMGLVFAARDSKPMPNSEIVTKSHNRCNRR